MTLLLIQVPLVLLITLLCGWVARKLGQSRVIGEMAGGILLGPSVFARFAPHLSSMLFPASSLGSFETLSTVGLILFLFLVGSQIETSHIRQEGAKAMLSSGMSVLLPFGLAALAADALRTRFAPVGVEQLPFLLFLGVSMSITAFPVLARILEERGMERTPLGVTALLCAAMDDVMAWSLLAVALTLVPHADNSLPLLWRLAALVVYLVVMLAGVRPLARWAAARRSSDTMSYELLGGVLVLVLASAAATEMIGIHPLFGAFLAGICFPQVETWKAALRAKLETLTSVLLLPFFFALTGIRTRLDLLHGSQVWLWTAVVLAIAVAGKVSGSVLAARWMGQPWRDAWGLGALLNTRGLVELVVLNIAYKANIFSPTLFTMLVVMALVTTMMTTPLLNLLGLPDRTGRTPVEAVNN